MSKAVKNMSRGRGRNRVQTLTRETADSLSQTLDGLVALTKMLLEDENIKYILLGVFQSDCIEGEFGIYRQAFGGLYYITLEQVLVAAKSRRLKLIQVLDVDTDQISDIPACVHCQKLELTDSDVNLIDELESRALDLTQEEQNSIFYVAGYVSKKEKYSSNSSDQDADLLAENNNNNSEFLNLVSRGKLTSPPVKLFEYCLLCYAFYKNSPKTCRRQIIYIFEKIHDSYSDFAVNEGVNRRIANTIMSGYVRSVSDLNSDKSVDSRKIMKLSE